MRMAAILLVVSGALLLASSPALLGWLGFLSFMSPVAGEARFRGFLAFILIGCTFLICGSILAFIVTRRNEKLTRVS